MLWFKFPMSIVTKFVAGVLMASPIMHGWAAIYGGLWAKN